MSRTGGHLSTIALAGIALVAGCAASEFDPSAVFAGTPDELLTVEVLGDGFVRAGDRRLPLELLVLELRQRARAMTADQLAGLRVHVGLAADGGDPAMRDAERLLDQLQIIGVRQVTFL
jgi:hypothetical protein